MTTEWVMVPREPTQAMILAAFDAVPNASGEGMIRARWRVMLDAAPAAPQQTEPVAWRIFDGEGGYDYSDDGPTDEQVKWSARWSRRHDPLFLRPPPAEVQRLRAEVEALKSLSERLKQEAQIHAQEARTANATIAECYQAATGGKGEPGNWHGAKPVRDCIDGLRAEVERAHNAGFVEASRIHGREIEALKADIRINSEQLAEVESLRADAAAVIRECGNALCEELSAYDIDPPIHHLKQASERCAEWLSKHDAARAAQGEQG